MAAFISLIAVLALVALPVLTAGSSPEVYGIWVPYAAVAIFVIGFATKVIGWATKPVPFAIPTTGGQQYSLPWIRQQKFDNPTSTWGVIVRMFLEVCLFRSLFRNTALDNRHQEGRVAYGSAKWLWGAAIIFHYSFLIIFLRHFRLFMEPAPFLITGVAFLDSLLQITVPSLYLTDVFILVGLGFLLARRFFDPKVAYISLAADYFPLLLILGIAISGIYMRYFVKVDVIGVKELVIGLVSFKPLIPKNVDVSFYVHLFMVCMLLAYFPFSKLMHLGGVFLSPTRNLANNTRMVRHINPWNDPSIKPHSYEDYENDFREKMIEAGLPVEKDA